MICADWIKGLQPLYFLFWIGNCCFSNHKPVLLSDFNCGDYFLNWMVQVDNRESLLDMLDDANTTLSNNSIVTISSFFFFRLNVFCIKILILWSRKPLSCFISLMLVLSTYYFINFPFNTWQYLHWYDWMKYPSAHLLPLWLSQSVWISHILNYLITALSKALAGTSKLEKILDIWHAGKLFYALSTWGLALAG